MPSAGRPFTHRLLATLIADGVLVAPVTLHAGVASFEDGERPDLERYEVSETTAGLVNHVKESGGRVVAVGTTSVRAVETMTDAPDVVFTSGAVVVAADRDGNATFEGELHIDFRDGRVTLRPGAERRVDLNPARWSHGCCCPISGFRFFGIELRFFGIDF